MEVISRRTLYSIVHWPRGKQESYVYDHWSVLNNLSIEDLSRHQNHLSIREEQLVLISLDPGNPAKFYKVYIKKP